MAEKYIESGLVERLAAGETKSTVVRGFYVLLSTV